MSNSVVNPPKVISIQRWTTLDILLLVLLIHCINLEVHIVGLSFLKKSFLSIKLETHSYNSLANDPKKILYSSVNKYLCNHALDVNCRFHILVDFFNNSPLV